MESHLVELIKKKTDEQLLEDLKLGKDGFQVGVFDLYIAEAKNRNLKFDIELIAQKSDKDFNFALFVSSIEDFGKFPVGFTVQIVCGIITIISIIIFRIVFPFFQTPSYFVSINIIFGIAYFASIAGIVILVPISAIMNPFVIYQAIKKINIISDNQFKIETSEVLMGLVVPFVNMFYVTYLIYQLLTRIKKINNRDNTIAIQTKLFIILQTAIYSVFQAFSIFILLNKIKTAAESLKNEMSSN
jgi:hypothetical protein